MGIASPSRAAIQVAPHWGAWIEIDYYPIFDEAHRVAPHWGAWIEILQQLVFSVAPQVAPHWGAWIEIRNDSDGHGTTKSHPTGVRGLKYGHILVSEITDASHPTGVRGLKSGSCPYRPRPDIRRTPLGCVD